MRRRSSSHTPVSLADRPTLFFFSASSVSSNWLWLIGLIKCCCWGARKKKKSTTAEFYSLLLAPKSPLKLSFVFVSSFPPLNLPIHSLLPFACMCTHTHTLTHRDTHAHHAPDNHQLQGTLYCFSSVLITSGLDLRFSQRAAEGDVCMRMCLCVSKEKCVLVGVEGLEVGFSWVERSLLLPINCHTGFA